MKIIIIESMNVHEQMPSMAWMWVSEDILWDLVLSFHPGLSNEVLRFAW